jgi:hypothetical protein
VRELARRAGISRSAVEAIAGMSEAEPAGGDRTPERALSS